MKKFYSERNKIISFNYINTNVFKTVILNLYNKYYDKRYFMQYLGSHCTYYGHSDGELGDNDQINLQIMLDVGKLKLWPISENLDTYSLDDCFDIVEFLYEYVSKPMHPLSSSHHESCGYHEYQNFDKNIAQNEFKEDINKFLRRFQDGYLLDSNGHISHKNDPEFENLIKRDLPSNDFDNITQKFENAKTMFLSRDLNQRGQALTELAKILEFLRGDIKRNLLTKDESDLFDIINNFGIRHHNKNQKNHYDKSIYYSWLFYYFVASIHAIQRLINRNYECISTENTKDL